MGLYGLSTVNACLAPPSYLIKIRDNKGFRNQGRREAPPLQVLMTSSLDERPYFLYDILSSISLRSRACKA